jgi:hypothetical protein
LKPDSVVLPDWNATKSSKLLVQGGKLSVLPETGDVSGAYRDAEPTVGSKRSRPATPPHDNEVARVKRPNHAEDALLEQGARAVADESGSVAESSSSSPVQNQIDQAGEEPKDLSSLNIE